MRCSMGTSVGRGAGGVAVAALELKSNSARRTVSRPMRNRRTRWAIPRSPPVGFVTAPPNEPSLRSLPPIPEGACVPAQSADAQSGKMLASGDEAAMNLPTFLLANFLELRHGEVHGAVKARIGPVR